MKKKYTSPSIELLELDFNERIATSGGGDGGGTGCKCKGNCKCGKGDIYISVVSTGNTGKG